MTLSNSITFQLYIIKMTENKSLQTCKLKNKKERM